jgi:hypothetical protein
VCDVCVSLCSCVFVLFIVYVSIALMQQVSEMESHSVQLEKMEKEFLGKAKMEIQKHPEMAKLLDQELAFEQDEQLQGRFPICEISQAANPEQFKIAEELDTQMGWGPWSYGDPMRQSFDFKMVYELSAIANKMAEEVNQMTKNFLQMFGMFVLIVGVAGQLGGWSTYEMAQLIVQLLMSWQLLQMMFEGAKMKVLIGKMTGALEHLRFISSAAGGNQVKQLMGVFDKVCNEATYQPLHMATYR